MENQVRSPVNAEEVRAAAKGSAVAKEQADKPQYVYVVTEPCHRDGLYYDPGKWAQDGGEGPLLHVTDTPQVSKALVPYDEATEKATAAKALEFDAVKRKRELGAHPELAALVERNARLEAVAAKQQEQIAELIALSKKK